MSAATVARRPEPQLDLFAEPLVTAPNVSVIPATSGEVGDVVSANNSVAEPQGALLWTPFAPTEDDLKRASAREALRTEHQVAMHAFPLKKPQKDVHRDLQPGWLMLYVIEYDNAWWGRWQYWLELILATMRPDKGSNPAERILWTLEMFTMDPDLAERIARIDPANPPAIPQIEFEGTPHAQTRKMLEQCLNAIPAHHEWRTWGGSDYFDYFLDWLLFGLGHLTSCRRPSNTRHEKVPLKRPAARPGLYLASSSPACFNSPFVAWLCDCRRQVPAATVYLQAHSLPCFLRRPMPQRNAVRLRPGFVGQHVRTPD